MKDKNTTNKKKAKPSIGMKEGTRRIGKILLVVFGASFLVLVAVLSFYLKDFQNKTYPNIYFHGQNLSGLSKQQLEDKVSEIDKEYKKKELNLQANDKSKKATVEDLGWGLDKKATADKIYRISRSDNFLNDIIVKASAVFYKRNVDPSYSVNENALNDWIDLAQQELGKRKQEGNLKVTSKGAKVIEPKSGEVIDENEIRPKIAQIFEMSGDLQIKTQLKEDKASISKEDAEALISKAEELTKHNVQLVAPKGESDLYNSYTRSWVELKRERKETKTLLKKDVKYGPVYVSFNHEKIGEYLTKNDDSLNIQPRNAKLTFSGGKITIFQNSADGQVIKIDESITAIMKGLENGDDKITLPAQTKKATINAQTANDIEKYGIKELVGTASTNFAKSPDNRVHNIQIGTGFLSGVLVEPGEEFSTIKKLGSIDGSTGYLPELVIKENETIPEYGGGLCQVSTTLFRAAMSSGLDITERQNHSYRVSYYEPPVGMDATIYSPKPDFKFLNNTDSYILIQGRVEGYNVTFDLYGTKDGRQSSISDPVVYDITPAGDPIYKDDPSLSQGEEKVVAKAHRGAKASFTYRVTKAGKEIINQTFNSVYVPWPARILRGTGEPAPQE